MALANGTRTPGTYVSYNLNAQRTGLPASTQKILFITGDTFVGDQTTPVDLYDATRAKVLFGADSVAGRMITAALKASSVVDVQVLGKPAG